MSSKTEPFSNEVALLLSGRIQDPEKFLGLHEVSKRKKEIRLWRPGANKIFLEVKGKIVEAKKVHSAGLFVYSTLQKLKKHDYRIYLEDGRLVHDPYSFKQIVSDYDIYLFKKGVHYEIYNFMGAHQVEEENILGMRFTLWAPNANGVFLVGDFCSWNDRLYPMKNVGLSGIFEIFIPGMGFNEKYKFAIITQENFCLLKADPYSFQQELRPSTASITTDSKSFQWTDENWQKTKGNLNQPMNIYELHLGSWKKHNNGFFSYKDIAHEIASFCKKMHYTHVEFLPVLEHPLDESWGYQVVGFYAPTSRFGTFRDFQYLINYLHNENIGVILDWVPAHFPEDDFALSRFDGTALYEHEDPKKGKHPHWNTNIFNYGRPEVSNFLIGSSLFWLNKMHIDGLRVDAVASMLYLDYGRKEGEWIPNLYGGNINLEAVEFLKHLNAIVHEKAPNSLMIAEESSSFKGVSHALEHDGLGFDLKWNMGWMNDILRYFSEDPINRKFHHDKLTFSLIYAFSEKFVLVLSHDEVVHQKKSLIEKMPGDYWQKFANLRLLYSYMICHPGKKLLFMGGEIGQWREWNCKESIEWSLLDFEMHQKLLHFVQELNQFYKEKKELWEVDFSYSGYEWIDFSDKEASVISYLRKSASGSTLFCVHNFTPVYRENYFIPLKNVKTIQEIFSSDHEAFGGSNKLNKNVSLYQENGIGLSLAPLSTMIFEVQFA